MDTWKGDWTHMLQRQTCALLYLPQPSHKHRIWERWILWWWWWWALNSELTVIIMIAMKTVEPNWISIKVLPSADVGVNNENMCHFSAREISHNFDMFNCPRSMHCRWRGAETLCKHVILNPAARPCQPLQCLLTILVWVVSNLTSAATCEGLGNISHPSLP